MIYMNWTAFQMYDSVKLNKINTFQLEFAVILSKSLLVVLKTRHMWNISNRQWKGHANWKLLMNWSIGLGDWLIYLPVGKENGILSVMGDEVSPWPKEGRDC